MRMSRAYLRYLAPMAVLGLYLAGGCAHTTRFREEHQPNLYLHSHAYTTSQSGEEHYRTVRSVVRRDAQAFMDDLDLLFMTDRPSRLTKWHDR